MVLNGFGKGTGLVQVNELSPLKTPILPTNTFACANALIRRADPATGRQTATVNPVVLECNDSTGEWGCGTCWRGDIDQRDCQPI